MVKMSTIAVTQDLKDKIKTLGIKGESYNEILEDMYKSRKKDLISEILMDTSDCIPIDDVIKELEEELDKK